ncbi:MAG: flagellar basal body P-ring formation chaperone FlgA, partial [Stellaceae bacterium]
AAVLLVAALPASGETLRPVVTVTGPVIHVGDLFTGAGAHAGETVAPSPPAGTRITYGADWLGAVAREHGLAWQPGSALDQVRIDRASRVIDSSAIKAALMRAIAAQVSVAGATLELDNPGLSFVVPAEAPRGLAIDGLAVDRGTGLVTASIAAPASDPAAKRRRIVARLIYHASVPVLTHPMAPGATIAAADLGSVTVRRDRLAADSATDPAQLIGKTPRRPLAAGMPVRLGDLAAPLLVHRGALVTLVLETPDLRLTSQGKALDDGTLGALVRVQNTASNRIIDATVLADGVATVATPGSAIPARLAQQ